jgi:hypothetical protein
MPTKTRKLKSLIFVLDGEQYHCQAIDVQLNNNTSEPTKTSTYCPDGDVAEEADPDWQLQLEYFADWTVTGLSTYLRTHSGEEVEFEIDWHEDDPNWHTRETGRVKLRAPSRGGAAGVTERQTLTLAVLGEPEFTRP